MKENHEIMQDGYPRGFAGDTFLMRRLTRSVHMLWALADEHGIERNVAAPIIKEYTNSGCPAITDEVINRLVNPTQQKLVKSPTPVTTKPKEKPTESASQIQAAAMSSLELTNLFLEG